MDKAEWKQVHDFPPVWHYDADDLHMIIEGIGGEYHWFIGFRSEGYACMMGSAPSYEIAQRDCESRIDYLLQDKADERALQQPR
jgi:hypothetical protein